MRDHDVIAVPAQNTLLQERTLCATPGGPRMRVPSPAQRGKVPKADGGALRAKSRVAHRVGSYKCQQ